MQKCKEWAASIDWLPHSPLLLWQHGCRCRSSLLVGIACIRYSRLKWPRSQNFKYAIICIITPLHHHHHRQNSSCSFACYAWARAHMIDQYIHIDTLSIWRSIVNFQCTYYFYLDSARLDSHHFFYSISRLFCSCSSCWMLSNLCELRTISRSFLCHFAFDFFSRSLRSAVAGLLRKKRSTNLNDIDYVICTCVRGAALHRIPYFVVFDSAPMERHRNTHSETKAKEKEEEDERKNVLR